MMAHASDPSQESDLVNTLCFVEKAMLHLRCLFSFVQIAWELTLMTSASDAAGTGRAVCSDNSL